MDQTALYKLSYGLYIIGAFKDDRAAGCVVNTCFQVTASPAQLVVSLNKDNYTLEAVRQSGRLSVSILSEDTDPSLIGTFGFFSSRDTDKYKTHGMELIDNTPCVGGKFAGRIILEAKNYFDCGTHVMVLCEVIDTVAGEGTPMTYAYYHNVIKGKEPKNAPTYRADAAPAQSKAKTKIRYRCTVCGYETEYEGPLPDDYLCPICGVDSSFFEVVE